MPPLCPHSLCTLRQACPQSPQMHSRCWEGGQHSPFHIRAPVPRVGGTIGHGPRPVDTGAPVGSNRNPRQTTRWEGRCGGRGGDRGDDECIQCPRQRHHRLQVHARKFMAPSPGPGDLCAVCHSQASFLPRPPSTRITRQPPTHPRGVDRVCLFVSCRDMRTPHVQAPPLTNFPAATASSETGSPARGHWAPEEEGTARWGVGALTQEDLRKRASGVFRKSH